MDEEVSLEGEAVEEEMEPLEVLVVLAVEAKSEYGHGDLNEWTCKREKLCDK